MNNPGSTARARTRWSEPSPCSPAGRAWCRRSTCAWPARRSSSIAHSTWRDNRFGTKCGTADG